MKKIPKTIASKSVYKNQYLQVKVDTLKLNGNEWEYAYFLKPNRNGVSILPVDEKGIYLVYQYRHASNAFLWQIPMGMIDKGSSEIETARNELLEEAGIVAKKLIKIGSVIAEPGMSNQEEFVYVAKDLTFEKQKTHFNEVGMEVKHFTYENIKEMVRQGEIKCGFTLSALHLFRNNYLKKS